MKKLLLALGLILCVSSAWADRLWQSSMTATADTTQSLCGTRRGVFHGVRVNTGSAGTLTIYNSRGAASRPVAGINTAAVASLDYDVILSSGLTYTNSSTGAVTILYECF